MLLLTRKQQEATVNGNNTNKVANGKLLLAEILVILVIFLDVKWYCVERYCVEKIFALEKTEQWH